MCFFVWSTCSEIAHRGSAQPCTQYVGCVGYPASLAPEDANATLAKVWFLVFFAPDRSFPERMKGCLPSGHVGALALHALARFAHTSFAQARFAKLFPSTSLTLSRLPHTRTALALRLLKPWRKLVWWTPSPCTTHACACMHFCKLVCNTHKYARTCSFPPSVQAASRQSRHLPTLPT